VCQFLQAGCSCWCPTNSVNKSLKTTQQTSATWVTVDILPSRIHFVAALQRTLHAPTDQTFWHSTPQTRHTASTSTQWHFAFGLCCHSNETCAPIANLPNSAQLEGTTYHSRKLHPGPCSSVGMWPWTDRQTDMDIHRRVWPIYISPWLRLTRNVIIQQHLWQSIRLFMFMDYVLCPTSMPCLDTSSRPLVHPNHSFIRSESISKPVCFTVLLATPSGWLIYVYIIIKNFTV